MNRGYVKLWRVFLDGGYIQNHKVCAFMIWCILKANHKKNFSQIVGRQKVFLQPGQFVFGRQKAAKETGLSEQETRTIIELLKKIEFLTIKSTNKFSIITLVNWHTYQVDEDLNQPSNQPATNQQLTTNKNKKYMGSHFSVNETQHQKYEKAYPLLDILGEYKEMDAWLESNPSKRKTERGYPRFVNGWLSNAFKELKKDSHDDWKDKYPDL